MPGTFSLSPRVSDPDMHHVTCVTQEPWCMPGSLTSGFLRSRRRGKRFWHSQRMRNPQFYVSGKRPMVIRFKVRSEDKQLYLIKVWHWLALAQTIGYNWPKTYMRLPVHETLLLGGWGGGGWVGVGVGGRGGGWGGGGGGWGGGGGGGRVGVCVCGGGVHRSQIAQ